MALIPAVHAIDLDLVYAYLYEEADRLMLFDTGIATSGGRILDEITALGRKPADLAQIVVSHYHADHAGSLAELAGRTGAQVLVHRLDAPVVRGEVEEPRAVPESEVERQMIREVTKAVPPAPRCAVDRELEDGDEIELDGAGEVVHVPGHTAGSIALYLPRRRALFSADAAVRDPDGNVIVGVFNVDTAQARRSFARLAELDFEVACFGHGAPLDKDASLAFRRVAERMAG